MTNEEQIMLKARERFIKELPLQLEAIQLELSRFSINPTEAHRSICSILHQIKGAAGFFGFTAVVSEIKNFELLNNDRTPTDLFKAVNELDPITTILTAIIQTGE